MNLFKKQKQEKIFVSIPSVLKWEDIDRVALFNFLSTGSGTKLVELCRHHLFSNHLQAVQDSGNAECNNASLRGQNNMLCFIVNLAIDESISGSSPAKGTNPKTDQAQSEIFARRAFN